jgi:hypothetical protein
VVDLLGNCFQSSLRNNLDSKYLLLGSQTRGTLQIIFRETFRSHGGVGKMSVCVFACVWACVYMNVCIIVKPCTVKSCRCSEQLPSYRLLTNSAIEIFYAQIIVHTVIFPPPVPMTENSFLESEE